MHECVYLYGCTYLGMYQSGNLKNLDLLNSEIMYVMGRHV